MHMTEMNDRNNTHVNQEFVSPKIVPDKPKRRIRVRTVLVPLFFMLLHTGVMSLVMFVYVLFYTMSVDPATADTIRSNLGDPVFRADFLIEINAQTYVSLFSMLLLIPIYLFYVYWRKRNDIQVLDLMRLSPAQIINAFMIIIGAMGLTQLWMAFLMQLDSSSALGVEFKKYTELMKYFKPSEGWMFAVEIVATVILVPIGEELLFRGIIQDELRRALPPVFAVIATSLLFAIFHGNLIQGSYVFFVGLALSIVYYLTGNFLVPVGMHIIFNVIGSGAFSKLFGLSKQGETVLIYILYAAIPLMIFGFGRLYRLRGKLPAEGGS